MRENKSDDLMMKGKKGSKEVCQYCCSQEQHSPTKPSESTLQATVFCPNFFQLKKPPLNLGVTSAHYINLSSNETKLELGDSR